MAGKCLGRDSDLSECDGGFAFVNEDARPGEGKHDHD